MQWITRNLDFIGSTTLQTHYIYLINNFISFINKYILINTINTINTGPSTVYFYSTKPTFIVHLYNFEELLLPLNSPWDMFEF